MWYATEESSPFAVPNAFYYVTYGRRGLLGPSSWKTAELVSRLMKKVKPDQWTQLYRDFRWIHLTVGQVPKLAAYAKRSKDVAVELLGVASLNANGHVRQAALERLADIDHPRAVPYVMLRLADWVPAVRQAAQNAMMRLLAGDHAAVLLQYGHLVDWLERVQRVDLSETRTAILATLRSERCRETLMAQLKADEPGTRFFCYRILAGETDDIAGNPALIGAALSDRSPAIRRWMARTILRASNAQASEATIAQWLPRLLTDKSARVRIETIRWLPESLWPAARDAVGEMIYSDSPGLRNAARFLSKSHGVTDFAERYRERLEQLERLEGANTATMTAGPVAGLCETGDKTDINRIARYADHLRPRVREAALAGLGHLNAETATDRAIQALSDTNASVRRAGVRILQKAGSHRCRQQVLPILEAVIAVLAEYAQNNLRKEIATSDVRQHLLALGFHSRQLAHDDRVGPAVVKLQTQFSDSITPGLIAKQLIQREETTKVLDDLKTNGVVVLHGAAGCGKTGILYELTQVLSQQGHAYLPVRLDRRLPANTPRQFGHDLGLPESPVWCLESLAGNSMSVLILDQLDALRWTSAHSANALDVCKSLVQEVQNFRKLGKNISAVLACRTFDLEHDPEIKDWLNDSSNLKCRQVKVESLPEEAVKRIVASLGQDLMAMSPKQKRILQLPQHLGMWAEIVSTGEAEAFQTSVQLMQQFWDNRYGEPPLETDGARCNRESLGFHILPRPCPPGKTVSGTFWQVGSAISSRCPPGLRGGNFRWHEENSA